MVAIADFNLHLERSSLNNCSVPMFGMSENDLDFLTHYDTKYRMGDELEGSQRIVPGSVHTASSVMVDRSKLPISASQCF
jgi:hypothetical protein